MGNYNPNSDDLLILNVTLMLVDDLVCNHGSSLPIRLTTNFNGISTKTITQNIIVNRTGEETAYLYFNASILNATSVIYNSK
jgi:hypothetical protein